MSRRRTRSSERDHLEPQGSRCRPRRHRRGIYPSGPAMSAGPPRVPPIVLLGPVHAQKHRYYADQAQRGMRRRGRHFRGAARLRSNAGSGRVAGARRGRRQPLARTEPASHRVIRSQAGHGAYRAGCRGGGADQPATGKKLSALLDDVVKRARDTKGVEVRTGNYNVWPNTGSKGKIAGWRGQGEVILESGFRGRRRAGVEAVGQDRDLQHQFLVVARCARGRGAQAAQEAAQAFRTGRWPPPTLLDFRATAWASLSLAAPAALARCRA